MSLREQEGWGPEHRGGRLSLRKGRKVEELGAGMGRMVGWEGSEQQTTFIFLGLVFVSGWVSINTRT